MTDPFIIAPTKVSAWERVQEFIKVTARPLAIISTSFGASATCVIIGLHLRGTASEAAIYIAAILGGVATLYGAKSWENSQAGKHAATVEVAKATGTVQEKTE